MSDAESRAGRSYREASIQDYVDSIHHAFLFGRLVGHEPSERASAEEIEAMQRFHRLISERCELSACLQTPGGLAVAIVV